MTVRSRLVEDNKRNFPSKILRYVSFGLPILSSKCYGIEPKLKNALVYFDDENLSDLSHKLDYISKNYSSIRTGVVSYGVEHSGQKMSKALTRFLWNL